MSDNHPLAQMRTAQRIHGEKAMTRKGLEEISISGVWLHRRGDDVVVEVERKMADGTFQWFEVISEHSEGSYSHIVEPQKIVEMYWNGEGHTIQSGLNDGPAIPHARLKRYIKNLRDSTR